MVATPRHPLFRPFPLHPRKRQKNITVKKLLTALLLPLLVACTNEFEDLNTNPNAPSQVQPELLLRQTLYGYADAMAYEGFVAGNLLSQHLAMIDFNLFDRHALGSPQEGGDPWTILYQALRDNEALLRLSRQRDIYAHYEAPALILKAYFALQLTDLYGSVPYRQAVRAGTDGITNPMYDTQWDVYNDTQEGAIMLLRQARNLLRQPPPTAVLGGDLLFDGDYSGWLRFGRSLEMRAYARTSLADQVFTGGAMGSGPIWHFFGPALGPDNEIISSNDQNAVINFTDTPPNDYPLARARIGIFNVFLMSETAQDVFRDLNDPRIATIYRPSTASGEFRGVANGIDAATSIVADSFARPGTVFRENSGGRPFAFMTAWEVNFLRAEMIVRFANQDIVDPKLYYDLAVEQAFEYWDTPMPANYLTEGPAAYDPDRALEQILTQKWIANAGNSYEAWMDWRRTGIPTQLRPAAASLNDGLIPVRMPYPAEEEALNFNFYRAAAVATDGNSINFPVTWDVD